MSLAMTRLADTLLNVNAPPAARQVGSGAAKAGQTPSSTRQAARSRETSAPAPAQAAPKPEPRQADSGAAQEATKAQPATAKRPKQADGRQAAGEVAGNAQSPAPAQVAHDEGQSFASLIQSLLAGTGAAEAPPQDVQTPRPAADAQSAQQALVSADQANQASGPQLNAVAATAGISKPTDAAASQAQPAQQVAAVAAMPVVQTPTQTKATQAPVSGQPHRSALLAEVIAQPVANAAQASPVSDRQMPQPANPSPAPSATPAQATVVPAPVVAASNAAPQAPQSVRGASVGPRNPDQSLDVGQPGSKVAPSVDITTSAAVKTAQVAPVAPQQRQAQTDASPSESQPVATVGASAQAAGRTPGAPEQAQATDRAPAGEQIVRVVEQSPARAGQEITLRLSPPELGRVKLTFRAEGNDLRATLEVESVRTMSHLQREMPSLMQRLTDSGVQLRRLDFVLADGSANQQQAHNPLAGQQGFWNQQPAGSGGGLGSAQGTGVDETLATSGTAASAVVSDQAINVLM